MNFILKLKQKIMSKQRKSNFRNKTVSNAKQQKEKSSSYGYLTLPKGVRAFTIKEMTRSIFLDILPYEVTDEKHLDRYDPEERAVPGTLWYKRPFKVHRNVGADNQTVVCRGTIKKKCPICEYIAERLKAGADWKEMVDGMAKDRNLYVVQPIDSEEHEEELYIWDMSQHLFQNELNDQLEEDETNGVFPDLEEGKTLEVKFKWKKFGKSKKHFPETRDISFEDRDEAYDESILDEVPNLDEVLQIMTYKEMHDLYFEMDEADEDDDAPVETEDEEEETKPTRRKKKPVEKEEEEEPEEEPETKPSRRRKKPVEKEEDEDEPEVKTKPSRKKKEEKSDNECPHGFTYGKDCEEHDECDECDKWADCLEAKEKLEAK